jgi:hypothetical protein
MQGDTTCYAVLSIRASDAIHVYLGHVLCGVAGQYGFITTFADASYTERYGSRQCTFLSFREGLYARSTALSAAFSPPVFTCLICPWLPRELESRPSPSHNILM